MSVTTTLTPTATSSLATASPIPEPPPVTIATFPSNAMTSPLYRSSCHGLVRRYTHPSVGQSRGPWINRQDTLNEVAELTHVVAKERLRRFDTDLAVVRNQVGSELDVGFDCIHHG